MELVLTVTHCNGAASEDVGSARITDASCVLGRHPGCGFELPDPECQISGRHAVVSREGDRFLITDVSTNGTSLNDADNPLEPHRPVDLNDGDRLIIGQYVIACALVETTPSAKPHITTNSAVVASPTAGSTPDILDLIGSPSEAPAASSASQQPEMGKPEQPPEMPAEQTPETVSLADAPPQPAGVLAANGDNAGSDPATLVQPTERPAPDEPKDEPRSEPSPSPEARPNATETRPDDEETALAAHNQPDEPADSDSPVIAATPQSGISSGDPTKKPAASTPIATKTPEHSPETDSVSSAQEPAKKPTEKAQKTATPAAQDEPSPGNVSEPDAATGIRPDAKEGSNEAFRSAPSPVPSSAPGAELESFLAGLGAGDPAQIGDPEEIMRIAGELLRAMTQGLMAVMMTRANFKSELRLGVTTIRSRENNPFQFCVDPDDALERLLWRPSKGFLDPSSAATKAFDDIQTHQMALMAGLRGVLQALLARLEPHAIEHQADQQTGLDRLLPNARKAKCWDLFATAFDEIAEDASDDFMRLFGDAFNRAYDDQIERLLEEKRQQSK